MYIIIIIIIIITWAFNNNWLSTKMILRLMFNFTQLTHFTHTHTHTDTGVCVCVCESLLQQFLQSFIAVSFVRQTLLVNYSVAVMARNWYYIYRFLIWKAQVQTLQLRVTTSYLIIIPYFHVKTYPPEVVFFLRAYYCLLPSCHP